MTKPPILLSIEQRNAVGAIFDPILSKFGLRDAFDVRALRITDHVVVENTGNKQKLSGAVLDCMFPKAAAPSE